MDDLGKPAADLPYVERDALLAFGRTLLAVLDPDGRILEIAPSAQGILGMDFEALVGTRAADFFEEVDRDRFQRRLTAAAVSHERQRFTHGLAWRGGRRECETLLTPFRSPAGVRVHVAMTDLSHHLNQIEHLETAQALFQAVLAAAGDAIFGVDAHLRIVTASRRAHELFGVDPEDAIGRDLRAFFSEPSALDRVEDAVNGASDAPRRVQVMARRGDGSEFPAEVSASAAQLDHSVLGTVVVRDVTERQTLESELRAAARTDALTGLPNRVAFMDALRDTVARGSLGALLFVDLDGFKPINDRLGPAAGDVLLQQVAGRIQHGVRGTDLVARLGGDEFVVLLPGIAGPDAMRVATSIVRRLARPFLLSEGEARVTCSVGVAVFPADETDSERLLAAADAAMYAAKHAGRNRAMRARPG